VTHIYIVYSTNVYFCTDSDNAQFTANTQLVSRLADNQILLNINTRAADFSDYSIIINYSIHC